YSNHLRTCPWCEIADAGGPFFFVTIGLGTSDFVCSVSDLDPFWNDLVSWGSPTLPPPVAVQRSSWRPTDDTIPTFESKWSRLSFAISVNAAAASVLFAVLTGSVALWQFVPFVFASAIYLVAAIR